MRDDEKQADRSESAPFHLFDQTNGLVEIPDDSDAEHKDSAGVSEANRALGIGGLLGTARGGMGGM